MVSINKGLFYYFNYRISMTFFNKKLIFAVFIMITCGAAYFPASTFGSDSDKEIFDSQQQQPRLLYSDLVSGPVGSLVTIWAQNFSHDTELICGDRPCKIVSMEDDEHHPSRFGFPQRQRIVVKITDHISKLSLTGGNSLPFYVNKGSIHYAKPGQSLNSTLDSMGSGDILYLREGTYSSPDPTSYGFKRGNGAIIWATEKRDNLAVLGYPGEKIVFDLSRGYNGFDTVGKINNWTVANIECSGDGWAIRNNAGRCISASRLGNRNNFRVVGIYAHDLGLKGTGSFGEFSFTQNLHILGNRIERTGTPDEKGHVIYHGGRGLNKNIFIEYNHISDHIGRRIIQVYGHLPGESMSNLNIKNNLIINNRGRDGILLSFSDSNDHLPKSHASRNWIEDAVIDGNTILGGSGSGIHIRASQVEAVISNNHISDSRFSIKLDDYKSVKLINNCVDKEPVIFNQNRVVRENRNSSDCTN